MALLWKVLRMDDVGDKLFNGMNNMHVNSLICARVKRR